ncbi:hypothetical protein SLS62_009205 [Diatrype stigma]|uniref:Peroxin 11C n=1 Tax=Diatrype stigma TaxID=117547 RepID=A0AAN9UFL6_9PEZI
MSAEPDAVPSTTDLPSGEPVPTSNAEPLPVPQPSSKPSSGLAALLKTAPSDIDAFLAHLHRCLQTPSGIDTVLLFVCYTSRLSASVLQALTGPAIRRSARQLLAIADALPPSATLIFATTNRAFPFSPSVALVLRLAKRLKALSVLLSEVRTFMRLWGLLNMYFWARGLVLKWRQSKQSSSSSSSGEKSLSAAASKTPETDRVETTIAWAQLAACVAFQSLENAAFLSSKGVLDWWAPATQGKMARWSARFWGAFVGAELGRLLYEARKRGRRSARERIGARTVAEAEAEERAWSGAWRRSLVRNLAWAPLTVHWSLERGYVSEMGIGALACVPAFIQIRDLWRRTAE